MSIGRVTQRSMSTVALRGLQSALGRTQDLQNELSSGRRINRPGDDPAGAVSSMKLRSQRRADDQYVRNIDDANGRLQAADDAMQTMSERLIRVRGLLTQANNGAIDAASRQALAQEITAIRDDVVDLYNTRFLDRPVFGGTSAAADVVDPTSFAYLGDEQPVTARISRDATVRTDVRGTEVAADTLPALLTQAAADVAAGDSAAIGNGLAAVDAQHKTILRALGDVGARVARIEMTRTKVESEKLDFTSRISTQEEVDLPETIMKLSAQQLAYESALKTASKVMQVSLADYLR